MKKPLKREDEREEIDSDEAKISDLIEFDVSSVPKKTRKTKVMHKQSDLERSRNSVESIASEDMSNQECDALLNLIHFTKICLLTRQDYCLKQMNHYYLMKIESQKKVTHSLNI